MTSSISLRHDLEVLANIKDTMYNSLCCVGNDRVRIINHTHRYRLYVIITLILILIGIVVNDVIVLIISDALFVLLLILLFLECNKMIFIQGIKTFDVYYKVLNIAIARLTFILMTDFEQESLSCAICSGDNVASNIRITHGIFSVFISSLGMLLLSLIDGYQMNLKIKVTFVLASILYFIYLFCVIYFGYNINNTSSSIKNTSAFKLMNYSSLHAISSTTIINAIIFLTRQLYFIISKPNKLILVSTYVTYKLIRGHHIAINDSGNDDYDNTDTDVELQNSDLADLASDHSMSSSITKKESDAIIIDTIKQSDKTVSVANIDESETILNHLLLTLIADTNDAHSQSKAKAIAVSNFFNSRAMWGFYFGYILLYFVLIVIFGITNHSEWLHVSVLFIGIIVLILAHLNINYQIGIYFLKSFLFWWKLQDCVVLLILETITDNLNKMSEFSPENKNGDSTKSYSTAIYFIAVFSVMYSLVGLSAISMANGAFVHLYFKIIFIILAIAYWINSTIRMIDENTVYVNIFDIKYDLKTTIISKATDIIFWLIVQLINQIQFANGILVTGKVSIRWIGTSHNNINDVDHSPFIA